jgi:hypothetical protein
MQAFEHRDFLSLQAEWSGCNEAGGKGQINEELRIQSSLAHPPAGMFRTYFLLPLLIPLAFVKGNFAEGLFGPVARGIDWLSGKRVRAVGFVGVVSLMVCAGLSLGIGIPRPETNDEFGYLLLGDTFAHGRVTNPTPPLWEHFETIHEIMKPTYTAKYPPGQGVALAVGEVLGQPIIGVWLTTALACAAMCWMLLGWMPARWALAGGLLTALHPQVLAWSQDYWGGAVAMGGGALVLGGFRRLLEAPSPRAATMMGVGVGILADSRPYEGLVFCLLTGAALLIWTVKTHRGEWRMYLRKAVAPMAVVMAILACQKGYYDWRVTGNPLVMPYMVHIQTYGIDPVFIFSKPRPEPVYRHREIKNLQEMYLRYYLDHRRTWGSLLAWTWAKLEDLLQSYLWSLLLVAPLLGLPRAIRRDRRLWLVCLIGAFFLAGLMMETWMHAHYAAPGAAVFFLLVMESMREVNGWEWRGRRWGRNVLRGLAVLLGISFVSTVVKMAREADPTQWYYRRAAILDELKGEPGKSLVIVRYDADHNPNREWVYNEADIQGAKVILARDMGEKNKELLDYFRDRKVWVLHADAAEPKVEPYPGS